MTPLNDGIVAVYAVENAGAPGDMPQERLTKKGVLRYKRRTVGIKRYYTALQADAKVDLLLRVPYTPAVSPRDVAVPTLDGQQYRITLVQTIEDTEPPVMDLTLERLESDYDIAGIP